MEYTSEDTIYIRPTAYGSITEWYKDYQGYVPIPMAHALNQVIQRRGLTIREAYRLLLDRGAIVHIDPADDVEPEEVLGQ